MAIDRIGRTRLDSATAEPHAAPPSARPSSDFRLHTRPKPEAALAEAPATRPPTALEQLRAGKISVDAYVEAKVANALSHVDDLPAPQRDAIARSLREALAHDPAFLELTAQVA